MPKISVIVPVYNVEKYLNKCVDSLLCQEFQALEIILVDDGSTDNSGRICDAYAEKDRRIIVIHQSNQGLSAARNAGIDIATGDYIGFVDSDDFVSERMFSELYRVLTSYHADISVCSRAFVYEHDEASCKGAFDAFEPEKPVVFDRKGALMEMFGDGLFYVSAWDKLYKRELFDGVRYPVGKIHEDVFATYKLVEKANTVVYTHQKLYAYLQRDSSICHRAFYPKRFDYLEAFDEIIAHYQNADSDLQRQIYRLCYFKTKLLLDRISRDPLSRDSLRYFDVYRKYVMRRRDLFAQAQLDKRQTKHLKRVIRYGRVYFLLYRHKGFFEYYSPRSLMQAVRIRIKKPR